MDLENYKGELHTVLTPLSDSRQKKIPGAFPNSCLLHYGNPTVSFYFEKINKYTSKEAVQRGYDFSGNFKIFVKLIKNPSIIFLRHYLKKRGYKDGWRGLFLVIVLMVYEIQVVMKSWEMHLHGGKLPDVNAARQKMHQCIK